MYSEDNEVALGVLNSVIWNLYNEGEYRAAKLTERTRDRQAIMTYDKALTAQNERLAAYRDVDAKHASFKRKNEEAGIRFDMIKAITASPILAKVYFIFVVNPVKLKQIDNIRELYDRVTFSYLYTFEGWREDNVFSFETIATIRSTSSTVERAIRFIKQDKPEIFNCKIITEANSKEAQAKDDLGNSTVGLS